MYIFMNIIMKNLCLLHKNTNWMKYVSLRERMMTDARYINSSATKVLNPCVERD